MTTIEKIRTEIEAVEPKSHVQYGMRWADSTLMIPFHKVMQIIDKYAEQEPCDKCAMKNSNSNYCKNCMVAEYNGKKVSVPTKFVEQEPCDDAVSRKDAIKAQCEVCDICGNTRYTKCQYFMQGCNEVKCLRDLPSVRPQEPKTGHWIIPVQDDGMSDPIYYQVRCSECGFDLDPQTWHMELHQYGADKYCPNCGARMVEPQERSDKN